MVDSYPLVRNQTKESIAKVFLSFGNLLLLFPFIVAGLVYGNRLLFAKSTILLLFVMVYNTLLKQIFKVPLYPHLGTGYSFPSGHMHAFGIFYGYIYLHTQNLIVKTFLFIIFIGIGISLVYMRYHPVFDVFGAVCCLIAELFIDHFFALNYGEKKAVIFLFLISIVCMIILYLYMHTIEYHVWLAFYAMSGLILGFYFIQVNGRQNFLQKTFAYLAVFVMSWAIAKFWSLLHFKSFALKEITLFLITVTIVLSLNISNYCNFPSIFIDNWKIFQN